MRAGNAILVDTLILRCYEGRKCNFSHSKRLAFKKYPGEHAPEPPRGGKEHLSSLRSLKNVPCDHILKCHAYMFEKVGRYVLSTTMKRKI